jgi:oligoribonuclease (3'-5' exoribonuclease)
LDIAVQGPELYDITTSVDNLHYKTISEITELARRWTKHIEKEFYGVDFVYPEIL